MTCSPFWPPQGWHKTFFMPQPFTEPFLGTIWPTLILHIDPQCVLPLAFKTTNYTMSIFFWVFNWSRQMYLYRPLLSVENHQVKSLSFKFSYWCHEPFTIVHYSLLSNLSGSFELNFQAPSDPPPSSCLCPQCLAITPLQLESFPSALVVKVQRSEEYWARCFSNTLCSKDISSIV